jgi:hypothetical protein
MRQILLRSLSSVEIIERRRPGGDDDGVHGCKVGLFKPVQIGRDEMGYGFSILSVNSRALCALAYATQADAEEARAEVAQALEKAVEVTPQG